MGLINDPGMCPVCDTRNCQTTRHSGVRQAIDTAFAAIRKVIT